MKKSKSWLVQVQGELACFTSPSKVERDSYPIITPSAGRGVIDSILWKPAIRWVISKVYVLNPIKYTTIRRNELNKRPNKFGEADRDLRTTRALRDVNYILEVYFYMTDLAGKEDNVKKFVDMFERRMSQGQSYYDPFLGCREFPAQVTMFKGDPVDAIRLAGEEGLLKTPQVKAGAEIDLVVGTMAYDFQSRDSNDFYMFEADIQHGVMVVPPVEVIHANSSRS